MHIVRAKGLLTPPANMNVYRGCAHGCVYCDARSRCYGMTHDFEDIEVKINAPALLEDALMRKREKCMVGTGAMSDPYQPIERELGLTRKCLEIIARHGFGLAIQTKSTDILRDIDLLCEINERAKCVVQVTLTTFDEDLCKIVEPNVSTTRERVEAMCALRARGIPVVAWLTPMLPFLNDTMENLRGLLSYCDEIGVSGALAFGMGLTLRDGDREYYYQKLDEHFPGLKKRYIAEFGFRYELPSPNAPALMAAYRAHFAKRYVPCEPDAVFAYLRAFPRPDPGVQTSLFDGD